MAASSSLVAMCGSLSSGCGFDVFSSTTGCTKEVKALKSSSLSAGGSISVVASFSLTSRSTCAGKSCFVCMLMASPGFTTDGTSIGALSLISSSAKSSSFAPVSNASMLNGCSASPNGEQLLTMASSSLFGLTSRRSVSGCDASFFKSVVGSVSVTIPVASPLSLTTSISGDDKSSSLSFSVVVRVIILSDTTSVRTGSST
mmetsp:Transcript_7385/g.16353  ORF Transcript_7385/g.16353 Transcript_7385/m.16353 type:complete len:201 (-) Transcript_7385:296-898(-)